MDQLESGVLLLGNYASSIELIKEGREKVFPIKRKATIKADELFGSLSGGSVGFSCPDVLPKNCRHFSFTPWNDNICVVIEQLPMTRTVKVDIDLTYSLEQLKQEGKLETYGYKNYKAGKSANVLRLAFPYVVIIIDLTYNLWYRSCRVFYRTAPLTSLHDFLLKSNLLNVEEAGHMCIMGGESVKAREELGNLNEKVTLTQRIDQILNRVWMNDFNYDYNGSFRLYEGVPRVGNLLEWQYFSKVDPLFVFKVPWFQHERNLVTEVTANANRDYIAPVISAMQGIISGKREDGLYIERSMSESIYLENGKVKFDPGDDGYGGEYYENHSTEAFTVSVGDKLELDGKTYFITALKAAKGKYIDTVELEDEKGEKTEEKIDIKLNKKIIAHLRSKPVNTVVTKNGKTINRGDLIELKIPGCEKLISVDEVRVSRDGLSEVKCGKIVYLIDFIDFNIIDPEKLELGGIKFIKGDKYIINNGNHLPKKVYCGNICTFKEFKEGRLFFEKADGTSKGLMKLDIVGKLFDTVKKIDEEPVPIPAIRTMNRIFVSDNQQKVYVTKDRSIIISGSTSYFTSGTSSWDKSVSTFLLEDGKRFFLPSIDIDIDLRVGDDVIVTTWDSPANVLKIRKITGFNLDKKNAKIEVSTIIGEDKSTEQTVPFVDLYLGSISIGCIRKATNSVDGLTVGMEVIPKKKVPGFLKTKPCRISAFIMDHDVPLVLCSNYHTFWLTKNNKELFTFKSDPTITHEFSPKFTPQFGDILGCAGYDQDSCRISYYSSDGRGNNWKRLSLQDIRWNRYRSARFNQTYFLYGIIPQRTKKVTGTVIPDMFSWFSSPQISKDIM